MPLVTFIRTIEPVTGNGMVIAACELYDSLNQATIEVMRREYDKGIATWLVVRRVPDDAMWKIAELDDVF